MEVEIKGIHFPISDDTKEYVDKKLQKLERHQDEIVNMVVSITRDKSVFKVEANMNFRWAQTAHVAQESFELFEGIDLLFDKVDQKIKKEKEKIRKR